jgi:hypothetical protein
MITWFPNKLEAYMGIYEDGRIFWTISGAAQWRPILKKYGKTPGQITTFDEFRGIHLSASEIGIENCLSGLRVEVAKSPHTLLSLEYKILLAIMSGNDSDQAKFEAKRKTRLTLNIVA